MFALASTELLLNADADASLSFSASARDHVVGSSGSSVISAMISRSWGERTESCGLGRKRALDEEGVGATGRLAWF